MKPCFGDLQCVCTDAIRTDCLDDGPYPYDCICVANTPHRECKEENCPIWSHWAAAEWRESDMEIERLADWLMINRPEECGRHESAVALAIRLLADSSAGRPDDAAEHGNTCAECQRAADICSFPGTLWCPIKGHCVQKTHSCIRFVQRGNEE